MHECVVLKQYIVIIQWTTVTAAAAAAGTILEVQPSITFTWLLFRRSAAADDVCIRPEVD